MDAETEKQLYGLELALRNRGREIDKLEARIADLERLIVAGPGWIPSYLPPLDSLRDAGQRVHDRVLEVDSEAVTRPIDPSEIE